MQHQRQSGSAPLFRSSRVAWVVLGVCFVVLTGTVIHAWAIRQSVLLPAIEWTGRVPLMRLSVLPAGHRLRHPELHRVGVDPKPGPHGSLAVGTEHGLLIRRPTRGGNP